MNKTVTYESVEERLKDKPVSAWTDQDVFDRYVAYGDDDELDDPKIQKLLISHGYIDELINLVDKIIYDEEVIKKILKSKIIKEKQYIVRNGKINKIDFVENKESPEDFITANIQFEDKSSKVIKINDMWYKPKKDNYIQDIEKYKENVTIITEIQNNIERKICILRGILYI